MKTLNYSDELILLGNKISKNKLKFNNECSVPIISIEDYLINVNTKIENKQADYFFIIQLHYYAQFNKKKQIYYDSNGITSFTLTFSSKDVFFNNTSRSILIYRHKNKTNDLSCYKYSPSYFMLKAVFTRYLQLDYSEERSFELVKMFPTYMEKLTESIFKKDLKSQTDFIQPIEIDNELNENSRNDYLIKLIEYSHKMLNDDLTIEKWKSILNKILRTN